MSPVADLGVTRASAADAGVRIDWEPYGGFSQCFSSYRVLYGTGVANTVLAVVSAQATDYPRHRQPSRRHDVRDPGRGDPHDDARVVRHRQQPDGALHGPLKRGAVVARTTSVGSRTTRAAPGRPTRIGQGIGDPGDRPAAELLGRLPDRGERRIGPCRELDVVEADDGHVVRDAEAGGAEAAQQPDGGEVVEADDRGRLRAWRR